MPVYEYRCSKGHEYEKTEGFSAPSEQKCMNCGARARRLISRPAVIFKGSGFYSTDNRGSSSGHDSSASSSERDSSTASPERDSSSSSTSGNGHKHSPAADSSAPSDSKVEAAVD